MAAWSGVSLFLKTKCLIFFKVVQHEKSILCACVCRFNGGFVLFLRDTTGGGGSLTEANALPVSDECIDGTFKLEGIPAKTEASGDALQLVGQVASNLQVSCGDTVEFSFVISGADNFKQMEFMSDLDDYVWHEADWQEEGFPEETEYSCRIENVARNFDSVNWQVVFQFPIEGGKYESVELSEINIIVVEP